MAKYRAGVVSAHGNVSGVVGDDVVVLPNMDPAHAAKVVAARGVVAEVGGMLAHLAIVCREAGTTMMVLPDACSLLQPGMQVTLLPGRCEVIAE